MGALRLAIMILIVCCHMPVWTNGMLIPIVSQFIYHGTLQGAARVNMFLLQSGFFTQLAFFDKKVTLSSFAAFYKRKFLDIYPQYFFFLFITALYFAFKNQYTYLSAFNRTPSDFFTIIAANIFAMTLPSFGVTLADAEATHGYLFLMAAWPITVLIVFYLLAPLVLTSIPRLAVATLISSALMLNCYMHGVERDLLLTHLAYCFIGAWTGRIAVRVIKHVTHRQLVISAVVLVLALIVVTVAYSGLEFFIGKWGAFFLYTLLFAIVLIPLYGLTRRSEFDRFLSKVTYTLLLCHFLVINLVLDAHFTGIRIDLLTLFVSIELAVLLNLWWRDWQTARNSKRQEVSEGA